MVGFEIGLIRILTFFFKPRIYWVWVCLFLSHLPALHTSLSRSRLPLPAPAPARSLPLFFYRHLHPLLFRTVSWDLNFDRRSLETKMKRKNRSRFFDDDEELVADILLQVPHIVFQSESRLPFNWGFRRTRSAIDRSLPSHPKRKRTKLSYKKV